MKRKVIRFVALILAFCMPFICCPMYVKAAEKEAVGQKRYADVYDSDAYDSDDYDLDEQDDYDDDYDIDDYDLNDDNDYIEDDDDDLYDDDGDYSDDYSSDKYSRSHKSLSRIGKKNRTVSFCRYYTLKCKGYIYSAKSSNKKVVSIHSKDKGNGKLVINPKRYGKATITVKNKYGKKIQWVITVNRGWEFTILTGGDGFDMKRFIKNVPGWSKGKWSSKKPSVVSVRGRRCHGYSGGTTTITLKARSATYSFKVHVQNRTAFFNKAKATLKNNLLVPSSMRVNNMSTAGWTDNGGNAGVTISYSALNVYGLRVYNQFNAWYTWDNKFKWKFPD